MPFMNISRSLKNRIDFLLINITDSWNYYVKVLLQLEWNHPRGWSMDVMANYA